MLKNLLKKGIAVVLTLMLAFSVFAITASATTVSSAYDSEFTALMTDKYDSSLIFSSGDIGLANYDIVLQGKSWSSAYWNTRYNYIQYVPGKETEIVSKESYNAPGFTIKWEIFTRSAEAGTSEMSFGDLKFITNYGEKAFYLMLGESELARFDTGCVDATEFANKYCFNEYTIKYIDGVITVTRLITGRDEETTASNTPITWTLPGGVTSTEVVMPLGVDFSDAKITWESSSEIGGMSGFTVPAPFISQYNGNYPTLSNIRLTRNIGFSTLQKFADFVDGLAANLYRADVAKARIIYDAIVANGSEALVSEVAVLGTLIEAAENSLPEDGGDPETPHVHTYVPETTDASCTVAGSTTYVCAECGHSYSVDGEPLGHDFVGTETKAATCYEEGEIVYDCSRCDESYTESTDILEHNYTNGYCDFCGDREIYTPNGAEWAMDFVDADGNAIDTVATEGEFWMVVRLTNYDKLIGEMNNTGDITTSTYDRTIAFAISLISFDSSKVIAVRENNKIVYATPYKTATLSANYDSADGKLKAIFYSDDNAGCTFSIGKSALDANNGELFRVKVKTKLTEDGEIDVKFAAATDLVSSSVALVNKTQAGEWESGVNYTKDITIDERCYDTIYKMNVTTNGEPPHSHEYTSVTTEPTCTEAGKTVYTCACGHSYEKTIPATGHTFVDGKCECGEEEPEAPHEHSYTATTTPADCVNAGKTVYTCECGYSYEEVIDALGHTEVTETIDATCTIDGAIIVKCSVCGEIISTEIVAAFGHNYVGAQTKAPTCKEEGVKTYTCSNCSDSYTEAIAVIDHRYTNGYCDVCGEREVYTPDGAEWDIDFVDNNGKAIDAVSLANGEFWMVVRLANYADLIGEMNYTGDINTSTYDRTVAVAITFFDMDDSQLVGVYENDQIVYSTPYKTASLLANYDLTDGMFKTIFLSDDKAGCTFSVGKSDLDANNGELFRIKVKSLLVEEGTVDVKLVEKTAYAISSVALVDKAEAGEWEDEVSYSTELEFDSRCFDTIYTIAVEEAEAHEHAYTAETTDATCTEAGKTVYTCECGDSYEEVIDALGHNYVDGTCGNCGEADPDAPQGPTYVEGLVIAGKNVAFAADYTMVFAVSKANYEAYDEVYLEVQKKLYDGEAEYDQATLTETEMLNGMYAFRYKNFAAREIASEVKATVYAKDAAGNVYYGPTLTYSMREYAQNQITKSKHEYVKTMMVDFLNYGAAAQTYFGYNTGDLANKNIDAYQDLATKEVSIEDVKGGHTDTSYDIDITNFNLIFKSKITLVFATSLTDTQKAAYEDNAYAKVTYTNFEGEEIEVEIALNDEAQFTKQGTKWCVQYDGVKAREMDKVVTVAIYDNEGNQISNAVTYSVNSYAYSKLNNSDANLVALVNAMSRFGYANQEYNRNK